MLIDIRDDKSNKLKQKAVRFRDAVQLSEALADAAKWRSISKGAEPFPAPSHLLIFVHDSKVCSYCMLLLHENQFTPCNALESWTVHQLLALIHSAAPTTRESATNISRGAELYLTADLMTLWAQAPLHAAVSAAFNSNFVHCFTIPSKKLNAAKESEDISQPQFISTDAVAHLISLKSVSCDLKAPILVDVRRHDERALFGCIQGSVHVPVEQLANALQEPPATFEEVAGTPAWSKDDLLIFHSRESLRACWAAQLASERGMRLFFSGVAFVLYTFFRRLVNASTQSQTTSFRRLQ